MTPDIFSSFDSYEHNHPIFMMSFIIISMFISKFTKHIYLSEMITNNPFLKFIKNFTAISSNMTNKNIYSHNVMLMYMLLLMSLMNITGLLPYYFSWTSQMIFTTSIALPMWMMMILSSMMNKPKEFMAHLLPDGAPMWLNPALVIFESISVLVRPLTLSFRLAANMSAGHIVLILLTSFLTPWLFNMSSNLIILFLASSFFMMFEMTICLIQAFIFYLLLAMYANDHS